MAKTKKVYFKIHVPQFLKEVSNCAISDKSGVLFIPLNIFRTYLGLVAQRCSEINDPVLNKLMCEMALYEISDPESKDYDHELTQQTIDKGKVTQANLL
jgi:hypothetical protein